LAIVDRMISWCWSFLLSTVITQLLLHFLACLSILLASPVSIRTFIPPNVLFHGFWIVDAIISAQLNSQSLPMSRLGLLVQNRRLTALYDGNGFS